MATPSRFNSFGGSSLGGFQQQQGAGAVPSAYERLQQGTNPGSDRYQAQQSLAPGSMGLSNRPAQQAGGRSMYDPTRLAEQAFRSTTDPMQRLQIGVIRNQLMPKEQDDEFDTAIKSQAQAENGGQPPQQPTSGANGGMNILSGMSRYFNQMGRNQVNNAMNRGLLTPIAPPAIQIR